MKPICRGCKSTHILYKKTTGMYWCRRCGHEWPKKEPGRSGKTSKEKNNKS